MNIKLLLNVKNLLIPNLKLSKDAKSCSIFGLVALSIWSSCYYLIKVCGSFGWIAPQIEELNSFLCLLEYATQCEKTNQTVQKHFHQRACSKLKNAITRECVNRFSWNFTVLLMNAVPTFHAVKSFLMRTRESVNRFSWNFMALLVNASAYFSCGQVIFNAQKDNNFTPLSAAFPAFFSP